MKNLRKYGSYGFFLILLLLLPAAFSCQKQEDRLDIRLPTTNVLAVKSSWGVITSSYLRIREAPTVESAAVTLLSQGDVLEIISKDSQKKEVDGLINYWYEILYDGVQGWVFGHYIQLHDSKLDAHDAARSLE